MTALARDKRRLAHVLASPPIDSRGDAQQRIGDAYTCLARPNGRTTVVTEYAFALSSRAFVGAFADRADVHLEVEAHLGKRLRHLELDDAALKILEPAKHLRALVGICASVQRVLYQSQLAI